MGDYKQSVNWHYSKGNIKELIEIANDITKDEDDRELAKKLAEELCVKDNKTEELDEEKER